MAKVKYVGPFDAIEVVGKTVQRNHQFEVPDEVAGRPPVPRLAEAMAELNAAVDARDHVGAARLRDEIVGLDYGEGLLAQDDNFVPAAPKPANTPVAAGKNKDGDK